MKKTNLNRQFLNKFKNKIEWRRVHEQYKTKLKVVTDGIHPNDIYQGKLGNCYFLSSISAIAEHPERLTRLILTQNINEKHVYAVAINYCGVWKKIYLDSYFPVVGRHILFCHTDDEEIWAMLLEKAYAKLFSGYWNIGHAGWSFHALKDLTGAPCEYTQIHMVNKDTLWRNIIDCDRRDDIMVAATKNTSTIKRYGLDPGHAYTLVGAYELNGQRVLELRNPWGKGEWNGEWGDKDKENWTEELKNKYRKDGIDDEDETGEGDGRFFMGLNDFVQHFADYSTCFYEDDYTLSSFNEELKNNYIACYKAEITVPGEYFVMLSQEDAYAFYNPRFPVGKICPKRRASPYPLFFSFMLSQIF